MEASLLEHIRELLMAHGLVELSTEDATLCTEESKRAFVRSTAGVWWWNDLRADALVVQYKSGDGMQIVKDLLAEQESVFMVPTDDEPPPWPVFFGGCESIINLIGELRFFEYFFVDQERTWIVFDTHYNALTFCGALVNVAKNFE